MGGVTMAIYEGKILYGEYDAWGYRIHDGQGAEVYAAGNHPLDSASQAPELSCAVPVSLLAVYCEATGIEMAAERGARWVGAQPVEEGEDNAH
jgi:hypothetical protein